MEKTNWNDERLSSSNLELLEDQQIYQERKMEKRLNDKTIVYTVLKEVGISQYYNDNN